MIPARISGTTHWPFAKGVKAVPPGTPPLVNAQNVAPEAVVLNWRTSSALIPEAEFVIVIEGFAAILRFEPVGQDVMKPAARVKTFFTSSGVSKADGTAATLEAARMKVWWRASTVTISAATVKTAGLDTSGAAPRYLHWIRGHSYLGKL